MKSEQDGVLGRGELEMLSDKGKGVNDALSAIKLDKALAEAANKKYRKMVAERNVVTFTSLD